jgi:hypothetical protein
MNIIISLKKYMRLKKIIGKKIVITIFDMLLCCFFFIYGQYMFDYHNYNLIFMRTGNMLVKNMRR